MARSQGKLGYKIGGARVGSRDLSPREHESECVRSLEYDIERQQMTVHFNKRGSWVYFDVDPQVFAEFNLSAERGTYFNLYIRDRFEYDRLSS